MKRYMQILALACLSLGLWGSAEARTITVSPNRGYYSRGHYPYGYYPTTYYRPYRPYLPYYRPSYYFYPPVYSPYYGPAGYYNPYYYPGYYGSGVSIYYNVPGFGVSIGSGY
ncbi:MAG: hypothetical protein U1F66_06590 [bacterium]